MSPNTGISSVHWEKIRLLFKKFPNIHEIILFGSRAKGNYREGSDIDLALKGTKISTAQLAILQNDYDQLYLPWKLDLVIYDTIQSKALKDHVGRVGWKID